MAGGLKDYPPGNATFQKPAKTSNLLARIDIDEMDALDMVKYPNKFPIVIFRSSLKFLS
jgi:hypothetical protein